MRFNLRRAVNTLAKKDLKFLQPLYEAITNSLEANATRIDVELFAEDMISEELMPKIIGFSVTDNGDGFTKENRESFLELWSEKKIDLGCKGSGRFTWLSVFNDVNITSEIAIEKKQVVIPFNLSFSETDIAMSDCEISENKTIVKFENITERYYNSINNTDLREFADIDRIKVDVERNLLIKLFLLKNNGKSFTIAIKYKNQERIISEISIPSLAKVEFSIQSEVTKDSYLFYLYYHFIDNGKNSKKIYYCANNRTVKEEDDDDLKFSCALPNNISFNMLLCSSYLDDMVNDSRDDFPGMSNRKQANIACPLLFKDIKPELLKQMHLILLDKFPELETLNREQEDLAVSSSPYLAKYIRENTDIVKTEKSLTDKATKAFNSHKQKAKSRFEAVLRDKSIDSTAFNDAVAEFTEVAAAELGEYILYRDTIIKALEDSIMDTTTKEEYIHNIFIPKNSIINIENDIPDYKLTNMWLLDDKFMSFSNAFSDVKIKNIIKSIFGESAISTDGLKMDNKKPDIAVFYNREVSRDALVVEFKSSNASLGEKEKAMGEISRNCLLLKTKIPDINTVWAYIITTIDDEFEFSLSANGYKNRFTNALNGKIMYFYNEGVAHIYALDIHAITADAFARNKTFLDILKTV